MVNIHLHAHRQKSHQDILLHDASLHQIGDTIDDQNLCRKDESWSHNTLCRHILFPMWWSRCRYNFLEPP